MSHGVPTTPRAFWRLKNVLFDAFNQIQALLYSSRYEPLVTKSKNKGDG